MKILPRFKLQMLRKAGRTHGQMVARPTLNLNKTVKVINKNIEAAKIRSRVNILQKGKTNINTVLILEKGTI